MSTNNTKYSFVPNTIIFDSNNCDKQSTEQDNKPIHTNNLEHKFGKRHIQILWLCLILITHYLTRMCISVTMVAMTTHGHPNENVPVYNWSDKNLILSGFLWGYFLLQPIAGWLGNSFGAKWLLVGSLVAGSIWNILIPTFAAHFGSIGVLVCRIFIGVSQSFLYPCISCVLGKWSPMNERSRLGSFIYAGSSLGMVLSMLVSALLCNTWYGWPIVYYIFSGLGFVCALLYAFIGSKSPSHHSNITSEERYYIERNLPKVDPNVKFSTPWKSILISKPVWALFIAECGNNWGHWTLISQIPNYLNHVMKFDLKSYGILSSLPYLLQWITAYFFGFLADLLINKQLTSISNTRKIMNAIAFLVPSLSLIIISNTSTESKTLVLILLMVGVSCISAGKSGHLVNALDLAPNHTGTIVGIANGCSIGYASLGNVLVHLVVTDDENVYQWRIIFYWSAATYIFVTIVYCWFGSGEVQPWNFRKRKLITVDTSY